MAVTNKVIISLLAVATLGVSNNSIQADMITAPSAEPSNVGDLSVDVDLGQVGEAGDVVEETTFDLQAEQTSEADAPVVERATAAELPEDEVIPDESVIDVIDVIDVEDVEVIPEETFEVIPEETEAIEVVEIVETTEAPVIEVPEVTEAPVVVEETIVETAAPTPEPTVAPTPAPVAINYPAQGTIEYELFILINNEREANGLKPYTYRNDLAAAANVRAAEIVVSFSHTRPDGTEYYTVNESIVYGENLAVGYASAREVFDAWMASPSHRANILDSDYEACGFGFLANNDGISNYYWAQEFGYAD